MNCRVLFDSPGGGAWNMALDEALSEWAAESGTAVLRFYTWYPATLSLGYFQRLADRDTHLASRDCPVVRRASGGGAILHDTELTYSLAVPVPERQVGESAEQYFAVHGALVHALSTVGITATVRQGAPAVPPDAEPFLCFQRRALGDVLIGETKIAGSAQRRRRGVLLQHGSVLLDTSPFAPELPGLRTLSNTAITADTLAETWLNQLATALTLRIERAETPPHVALRARRLTAEKYATPQWTARR